MLRIFDATGDIGTLTMALRNLNIQHQVVGLTPLDVATSQTYQHLHGKTKCYSLTEGESLPKIDVLGYRFSTQDLSSLQAIEQLSENQKLSSMLSFVCSVVQTQKPHYLVMEASKQLIGKTGMPRFKCWMDWLESLGYQTYYQVLDAKDYNVPQYRERLYVISILDHQDSFEFPSPQPLTKTFRHCLEEVVDETFYLHQSFKWLPIHALEKQTAHPVAYFVSQTNPSKRYASQTIYSLTGVCPALSSNDYKRPIKILLTPTLMLHPIGEDRFETFTSHRQQQIVRKLTPKECWRLMGLLDEDYEKTVDLPLSKTKRYLQAGHANVLPIWEQLFKILFH